MKASVGVSLLIMLLVGCAATAHFSTPSGTPKVFMTGVAMHQGSRDTAIGVPQAGTTGQVKDLVAGFPPATASPPASMAAGIEHSCLEPFPNQSQQRAVLQAFLQHPDQPVVLDVVERAHTLIPPSRTRLTKPPKRFR
jgi:hypothetical protein